MIRIVWDDKLRIETTAYRLWTKVISKLMLFIELRLQVDHFFKDSLQSLHGRFLERTSYFQSASAGVCWTSPACVVARDGLNEAEGLSGSVHSPVKDVITS